MVPGSPVPRREVSGRARTCPWTALSYQEPLKLRPWALDYGIPPGACKGALSCLLAEVLGASHTFSVLAPPARMRLPSGDQATLSPGAAYPTRTVSRGARFLGLQPRHAYLDFASSSTLTTSSCLLARSRAVLPPLSVPVSRV